jgi:uncharacterized protein YbjQ (UPF0145 family)
MWQFWIQLFPVIVLLVLALLVGSWVERMHFRRLERRESALRYMLVTDLRTLPPGCESQPCELVIGEVVVASDYFKTFIATLKKLVGGELRTFETLMHRARREALVRMLESAQRIGANAVVNVRFSTSNIGSMKRNRKAAMVEMYAYGTAVRVPEH